MRTCGASLRPICLVRLAAKPSHKRHTADTGRNRAYQETEPEMGRHQEERRP